MAEAQEMMQIRIVGPTGIGKSAFLEWLIAQAADAGFTIHSDEPLTWKEGVSAEQLKKYTRNVWITVCTSED